MIRFPILPGSKNKLLVRSLRFYGALILGGDRRHRWCWAMLALFACFAIPSFAQSGGFAVLDPVLGKYQSFQFIWYAKIRIVAERLFWMLVLIDFTWSGVIYVLDKNTVEEIAISNVKKILTIGFFYGLLKFSDTWIPAIIHSFAKIGLDAGGVVSATPDGIAKTGYELALACFAAVKKLGMLDAIAVVLPVTLIAIVTMLAFLFVAAQLLVTLVESYLAIGAGVILLGFGGSRWTTDFATKYLQYAVGTGVKLMILYLVVGVGQSITAELTIDSNALIQSCLQALAVAAVYGYLAIQIPAMSSAMMAGSPSMTAGSLASSALTLGAAAAGAGAAVVGAGKAALSGAGDAVAGAAGLSQALSAGLNSAADHGLSGVEAAMHASGEVLGHGMALAAGGIGDAVAGGGKRFQDKVAASAGARIAAQIEAERGGAMQGVVPDAASAGGNAGAASGESGAPGSASKSSVTAASEAASSVADAASADAASARPAAQGVTTAANDARAAADLGDATGAELGPSSSLGDRAQHAAEQPQARARDPLHSQIRDLQGFVPADEALAASIQIDLKHIPD